MVSEWHAGAPPRGLPGGAQRRHHRHPDGLPLQLGGRLAPDAARRRRPPAVHGHRRVLHPAAPADAHRRRRSGWRRGSWNPTTAARRWRAGCWPAARCAPRAGGSSSPSSPATPPTTAGNPKNFTAKAQRPQSQSNQNSINEKSRSLSGAFRMVISLCDSLRLGELVLGAAGGLAAVRALVAGAVADHHRPALEAGRPVGLHLVGFPRLGLALRPGFLFRGGRRLGGEVDAGAG